MNCYREPVDLFVGGTVLKFHEGATQGNLLAMPVYELATVPVRRELSTISEIRQVLYADDSGADGKISGIHQWWDTLTSCGPSFGHFANAKKTWVLVKESSLSMVKDVFNGTEVNVTTEGRPYLGALGSS